MDYHGARRLAIAIRSSAVFLRRETQVATFRSDRVPTYHVETSTAHYAYRTFGPAQGVPLVLCQRFRGTMDHWDPALLDILAQERRIVIFDNAGIDQSTGTTSDSVAGMAKTAADFIDAVGFATVDLFGWSLGGTVAQRLTLDRPDLVHRLVLAATSPGGVKDGPTVPANVWEVALRPANDDEDFLYLFFTDTKSSRTAGLESLRRLDNRLISSRAAVGPNSVQAQFAAIRAWATAENHALPRLGEIAAPTLVANGVRDIMVPAYNSYVLAQNIADARLILYPDSGHGFLFQHLDQFGKDVLDFLR